MTVPSMRQVVQVPRSPYQGKARFLMARLVIQLDVEGTQDACALCGAQVLLAGQPQLYLAETRNVVCLDCGRRRAPSLAALLDLARVAERVGRIGRHTVAPPLNALLDLAHAAEKYTFTKSRPHRQAA